MKEIPIRAAGMVSALGLDAVLACAAARAGLDRLAELNVLHWASGEAWGETPVAGHAVPLIADGFVGAAKAQILAHAALKDLFSGMNALSADEQAGTAAFLLVADGFLEDALFRSRGEDGDPPSFAWRAQAPRLFDQLLDCTGLSGIPTASRVLRHGHHAEWASLLQEAAQALHSGQCQRAIVGAVDCAFEPRRLEAAADAELVKTAVNPAGHLPGEAAAFLLLDTAAKGGTSLGRLGQAEFALGRPIFDTAPEDGRIWAQCLSAVLPPGDGFWLGDLNGEAPRAQEWGQALVRLKGNSAARDWPLWLPALSFGECGAASGAVASVMALRAFARGYAPAPCAVLALASDNGRRGAVQLNATE
ncbi:MAG: hypothetical protein HYV16_03340 [Gammaproteobacteria bacterium]|nr:hypothetical protein [Gammaproteobacteria bacterium]